MTLPAWFDYLGESFSFKEFQFKKFCPGVKTGTLMLKILIKPLPSNNQPQLFERRIMLSSKQTMLSTG